MKYLSPAMQAYQQKAGHEKGPVNKPGCEGAGHRAQLHHPQRRRRPDVVAVAGHHPRVFEAIAGEGEFENHQGSAVLPARFPLGWLSDGKDEQP